MKSKLGFLVLSLAAAPAFAADSTYSCKDLPNSITHQTSLEYTMKLSGNSVKLFYRNQSYNYWFNTGYAKDQIIGSGVLEFPTHVGPGLVRIQNARKAKGTFFANSLPAYPKIQEVEVRVANSFYQQAGATAGIVEFWFIPKDDAAGDPDVRHPVTEGLTFNCKKI